MNGWIEFSEKHIVILLTNLTCSFILLMYS